jgi:hypothetical protein
MSVARAPAFFDYLTERENVRLRKEAGDFFPWTEDHILQTFKFTNVRRQHDRTSMELRERFYTPNYDDDRRAILMNCATFRYFGTYEFASAIGWNNYEEFDFEFIEDTATDRLANRERVFTGAYVITNQGISAPKQEVVVNYFLKALWEATPEIVKLAQTTQSWEKVARRMMQIQGFGGTGFMTKEVLLDTTYTGFWENRAHNERMSFPADWNDWTPIGPGALRGAARVLGDDSAKPLKNDKAFSCIMWLWHEQANFFGHEFTLSPTDIQFGLCEFDKYERVRLGQGKPRSKYRAPT